MFTFTRRVFGLSAFALGLLVTCSQAQTLRRVGVMNFNLGEDAQRKADASLGVSGNMGSELSDMMIERLVEEHKFDVINMSLRPELAKELATQQGADVDPSTAARLGKVIGVQTVLTGTITELSGDVNTGGFGAYQRKTFRVHVVASVQMIDVETHRILETARGSGDVSQTKNGVVVNNNPNPNGNINTFGTGFSNGLLQEAATKAIDQIVQKLNASPYLAPIAAPPPPPPPPRGAYEGTVADVADNTVIFKIPSADAAKVGDTVIVERVVRSIPDPDDPKKVLKVIKETVATARVTEVDPATLTATAQIVSGTVKLKDKISFKPLVQ